MAVFDETWWDARSLTLDGVDTRGTGSDAPRLDWIRWRLMDELLSRFYRDIGLEVGFGPLGAELYNDPVWSPSCEREARYFGRLCRNHVHPARPSGDGEMLHVQDFMGGAEKILEPGVWPSWSDYLRAAIETLGLSDAGVPGHEGCWHRRGKAIFPQVYRVALLIRTDEGAPHPLGISRMYSYPDKAGSGYDDEGLAEIRNVISGHGEPLQGSQPRGLLVTREGRRWTAMRADGLVMSRKGTLNLRELWQAGADARALALAVLRLSE